MTYTNTILNEFCSMKDDNTFEINKMQILPTPEQGGYITGRDGRQFKATFKSIINFFNADNKKIRIDIDHVSEVSNYTGAIGWIENIYINDDNSLWGDVEFNNQGLELIKNKTYRYTSPVLSIDQSTREIICIKSVALTNSPNLKIDALNKEQHNENTELNSIIQENNHLTIENEYLKTKILRTERNSILNNNGVPKGLHNMALNLNNDDFNTFLDESKEFSKVLLGCQSSNLSSKNEMNSMGIDPQLKEIAEQMGATVDDIKKYSNNN